MQNTLFTHDNLFVLHGMNSEIADLIYLDPPFNSKRMYAGAIGNNKSVEVSFKDTWTWQDVNEAYLEKLAEKYPFLVKFIQSIEGLHGKAMMAYVLYMTQRLIELHRILKPTGSIYLHCDPTASHYLKMVLDYIFGKSNFRNEIVWCYVSGGTSKKHYARKHDVILFYVKSEEYIFNVDDVREAYSSPEKIEFKYIDGKAYKRKHDLGRVPVDWWKIPILTNTAKERVGYPTQKPLELLYKIIKASSNKGDLVLDPFCGCATTCVAAQQLQRKWIGIDIEEKAVEVLIERLSDDAGMFKNFIHLTKPQQRTDIQFLPITKETKNDIKKQLFKQQEGHCNGCNVSLEIHHFEIDHVVPKAKGGGDYMENYQLLCGSCNRTKGVKPMEYLRMKIKIRQEMLDKTLTFGE